jgi:hypothetical protein
MPALETCRREIDSLHDFFVAWYAAEVDRSAFEQLETALAPEFEMVTPGGRRHDRAAVLEWIRDAYGRDDPGEFAIEIRDVERVADFGTSALVRYEEWHERDGETENGRVSTVLLREGETDPERLAWVDLHETFVEE